MTFDNRKNFVEGSCVGGGSGGKRCGRRLRWSIHRITIVIRGKLWIIIWSIFQSQYDNCNYDKHEDHKNEDTPKQQ